MTTKVIADRVRAVSADHSQGLKLKFVPILGVSHQAPAYELLRTETLPSVQVTEISSAGSVPELQVVNNLGVRVFLMDGQELVGAKQNRILNTDVLVPANSTIKIPVSCVERGRWRSISHAFMSGKSASHLSRSSKLSRVHKSLKSSGSHDADQGTVWKEVASLMHKSGSKSATDALSDVYAQREKELQDLRGNLKLPETAVGLAVFHGHSFKGLDIFDRHATLLHFWDTLVDSYAVDLLEEPVDPSQPATEEGKAVRAVLDQAIDGQWESFPPPGDGTEWRMEGSAFSAASLVWNDEVVVHLQVFPK